ncbi:hypothetical protein MMC18_008041 [Xylographa bjoerkii]|nr:hypothetical protein [Xylographa bjoerkii]
MDRSGSRKGRRTFAESMPWGSSPVNPTSKDGSKPGLTRATKESTVGPVSAVGPVTPIVPRRQTTTSRQPPSNRGPVAHSTTGPFFRAPYQLRGVQTAQSIARVPLGHFSTTPSQISTGPSQVTATAPAAQAHRIDPYTPAGHTGGRKRHLGPQKNRALERNQYESGMMIAAPLHEAHFDDNVAAQSIANHDPSTTQSRYGPVFHKQRPMIVVTMHENHYVAIPCFTYQGKGIEGKYPDDHVSIHDHRRIAATVQQTKHLPLDTGYMYDNTDVMNPASVAHFAYPVCLKYGGYCERLGYLTMESRLRLMELYRQTIPSPPLDKAAADALEAKLTLGKEKVSTAKRARQFADNALADKKKATQVVSQLVQPLEGAVKANAEHADALERLVAAMGSTNLGKGERK